jgi:MFS family permease
MKPRLQEAALLLAIFFDMVGFTMLIPNIQLRADTLLGSTPLKGPIIGLLLQSTFIIQLIASPQWGRFADRVGGKKIFVACQWLSALAMLQALAQRGAMLAPAITERIRTLAHA